MVWLFVRSCLVQRLPAAGGWSWVRKWQAAEPRVSGLVLAHWWAELGSGMNGCRAGGPQSSVGLLLWGVGAVIYMAGCRFQVVPKLCQPAGGETVSQVDWLRGPRCPRAGVGLLVGKAGAQGVPGLVLACWCISWVLTWQAMAL